MVKPAKDRMVQIPENSANSKKHLGNQFPGPEGDGDGCGTLLVAGLLLGSLLSALAGTVARMLA